MHLLLHYLVVHSYYTFSTLFAKLSGTLLPHFLLQFSTLFCTLVTTLFCTLFATWFGAPLLVHLLLQFSTLFCAILVHIFWFAQGRIYDEKFLISSNYNKLPGISTNLCNYRFQKQMWVIGFHQITTNPENMCKLLTILCIFRHYLKIYTVIQGRVFLMNAHRSELPSTSLETLSTSLRNNNSVSKSGLAPPPGMSSQPI